MKLKEQKVPPAGIKSSGKIRYLQTEKVDFFFFLLISASHTICVLEANLIIGIDFPLYKEAKK